MAPEYRVVVTPEGEKLLKALDPAVFQIIEKTVSKLKNSPELGKPLTGDLMGLLSWKVSRYRVVYSLDEKKRTLVIVGAGLRKEGDKKDVYRLLRRLKEKGLLDDFMGYLNRG